jgi:FKBP-type peptidyl-prolyl cis-trans isomerase FkpA
MKIAQALLLLVVIGLYCACSKSPASFDQVTEFTKDTTSIRSYLTENGIHATKLSQGIWFVVDSTSTGIRPTYSDSMIVNYKMKLVSNGSVADQSTTPTTLVLSSLITGIQYTMPQFQKGSRGRIFIPSYYGYGNTASGNIPANSSLIFDFKLIDVKDHQLQLDTAAIGAYLRGHDVQPHIDPSGLRYVIDTLRAGAVPSLLDSVSVKYTARLISTGAVVDQKTTAVTFLLADLIVAWQIALPKIQAGSTMTLYCPSSLAYGPNVAGTIPQNSNLVFTIQLVKVVHN